MSQATSLALDVALFPGCVFFPSPFLGGGRGDSNFVAQAGLDLLDLLHLAVGITDCTAAHTWGISLQSARVVGSPLSQRGRVEDKENCEIGDWVDSWPSVPSESGRGQAQNITRQPASPVIQSNSINNKEGQQSPGLLGTLPF